jgi:hypothetical protein
MQLKMKYTLMGWAAMLLSVVFLSCDKQPIGPEGPDPYIPPPPGTYMSFSELKALYPGAGDYTIPAGTKKVLGVVISNSANEAAGNYRLQDEAGGGLYLYTVVGSPVYPLGSILEIDAAGAGVFTIYNGDLELKSVPQTRVVLKSGTMSVTPRTATVAEIISNRTAWSSTLVKINNVTSITQASSNSTGVTYNVTDATGTLQMFVRVASGITVNTAATSVTGYVNIFNTTTQIGIRSAADLQ